MASPSSLSGTATVTRLTMRPYPAVFMSLAASRQKRNVPTTLVSSIRWTADSGVRSEWLIDAAAGLPHVREQRLGRPLVGHVGRVVGIAFQRPVDVAAAAAHDPMPAT